MWALGPLGAGIQWQLRVLCCGGGGASYSCIHLSMLIWAHANAHGSAPALGTSLPTPPPQTVLPGLAGGEAQRRAPERCSAPAQARPPSGKCVALQRQEHQRGPWKSNG